MPQMWLWVNTGTELILRDANFEAHEQRKASGVDKFTDVV